MDVHTFAEVFSASILLTSWNYDGTSVKTVPVAFRFRLVTVWVPFSFHYDSIRLLYKYRIKTGPYRYSSTRFQIVLVSCKWDLNRSWSTSRLKSTSELDKQKWFVCKIRFNYSISLNVTNGNFCNGESEKDPSKTVDLIEYYKNENSRLSKLQFSLQTSDQRCRAISALISAASPEKGDRCCSSCEPRCWCCSNCETRCWCCSNCETRVLHV